MSFGGATYAPSRDGARLAAQLDRVRLAMLDGHWHTLDELAARCGGTVASVSARLRDLRKDKFGGWCVEREYVAHGLWHYRLVIE